MKKKTVIEIFFQTIGSLKSNEGKSATKNFKNVHCTGRVGWSTKNFTKFVNFKINQKSLKIDLEIIIGIF